ncbi:MAG TPA: winged helix-turn-helix domain-containing protein [Thermoanaerobaculia bacterium]|jgi:serine/threonine-protein kinase|nr:winged helix-turn-helix domain-containing protein [Thermoanaerobaculia bacterium]
MSLPPESPPCVPDLGGFQLGDWVVRQAEGTLSLGDQSARLEPRVMDMLVYLAAHPERVVSKEELIEAVWGGSFVEEGALSQAVHSLRKALGDDARQPRYIQTIPKRGYRLVAPVVLGEPGEENAGPEAASPAPEPLAPSRQPMPLSRSGRRGRVLLLALAAALAVAAVALWMLRDLQSADRRALEESAPVEAEGTRIVVLPFENLGKPEDAYFADGLTEEITKDLASLLSLQVISRTSAIQYEDAHKSATEIGRELKVDYILEGTVRWATGPGGLPRVRITPQLIRVANDSHVWAEAFDRQVQDIFEVQAEISRRVIAELGIALMPGEKTPLREHPTENLAAYRAYLRGQELAYQPFYSEEYLRKAVPMFERAVSLDPEFAAAWAELSKVHSYLAFNADPSPAQVERSRRALDRALALDPDLPAVRLAQVYFTYRCLDDFAAAHRQLEAAARRYPNNAEILESLGLVLRRLGRLPESIDAFEKAFSLNPRTVNLLWWLAESHRALRDYEEADRYFAQAISMAPDESSYWAERALNRLAWTGDPEAARQVIEEAPVPGHIGLLPAAFQLDLYEEKYEQALARLSPEKMAELPPQTQSRIAILAVVARAKLGDRQGALAAAESNRVILEAKVARFPKEAFYSGYLAVTLAQLGREAEALTQADKAVRQVNRDRFSGPRLVEIQAMVDTTLGRRREALVRLARLLAMPYQSPVSVADLRLNPVWAPLRDDPGFADLLRPFGS